MEVTTTNYFTGNSWVTIEIPKYCPNCGIGNNPENKFIAAVDDCAVYSHYCIPCKKYHYTILSSLVDSKRSMLLLYPNKVVANIDPLFIKYAPRFVEFYSEAMEAEKMGLENITATGYRSAIECLIKDYALHFELDNKDYLANPKLTFNNAIDRYIKDDDLLKGALHFIREVGNHYTHWDKDTDISLPVLKSYIDIILQIFKSKFMLKHLPD